MRTLILAIALLTTGCVSGGIGIAADLPRPRPLPTAGSLDDLQNPSYPYAGGDVMIPTLHPPDGRTILREPVPRWSARLNAALVRLAPPQWLDWSVLSVLIVY